MKTVFLGPVFRVESGVIEEPGGVRARRDVIRHSGSVAVMPVDGDGSIMLVKQYRCAFARDMIELPAGRIDAGETAPQAARRELREEVGLGAHTWQRLIRIIPTPGFCDERVTIYRATSLFERKGTPDSDERITIMRVGPDEALALIRRGRIEDAKTVVALLMEAARKG